MVEKVFGRSRLQQRHREEALFPHCCDAAGLGWKDWMFKVWGSGFVGLGRLRRLCFFSAFFHLHDTQKTPRSGDEKVSMLAANCPYQQPAFKVCTSEKLASEVQHSHSTVANPEHNNYLSNQPTNVQHSGVESLVCGAVVIAAISGLQAHLDR